MRILMVNNIASKHGGAETMIAQLRSGLEAEGHEVRVIAGSEKGNGENIADATFKTFRPGSLIFRLMYVCNPFAYSVLRRELRDFDPDIVHLHLISKASPFILPLFKDYPTILTIHDHTLFDPTRIQDVPLLAKYRHTFSDYFIDGPSVRFYMEKLRFFLLRRFAGNVDRVFACSKYYADCAKSSGIFSNIRTLHNGITLRKYVPLQNKRNVLFVGRLSEDKGASVLIDAAVMLREQYPDMHVDIVGGGKQLKALRKKVEEIGAAGNITVWGHRSAADIAKFYEDASMVVVPSICPDNLPTVCIEAMATGRPVIASRTGGLPELIDNGATGLLVPPSDASALADSIHMLFDDPALMAQMGLSGRKKAEHEFSINLYVRKTLYEYEKLRKLKD